MFASLKYRLKSWLHRRALKRDPAWRRIDQDEHMARKAHARVAHIQAQKRERIHTALGWRGL